MSGQLQFHHEMRRSGLDYHEVEHVYVLFFYIVYCDVVNVQPRFNFSDEIIILNLECMAPSSRERNAYTNIARTVIVTELIKTKTENETKP